MAWRGSMALARARLARCSTLMRAWSARAVAYAFDAQWRATSGTAKSGTMPGAHSYAATNNTPNAVLRPPPMSHPGTITGLRPASASRSGRRCDRPMTVARARWLTKLSTARASTMAATLRPVAPRP